MIQLSKGSCDMWTLYNMDKSRDIMLSKINQSWKDIRYMIPLLRGTKESDS